MTEPTPEQPWTGSVPPPPGSVQPPSPVPPPPVQVPPPPGAVTPPPVSVPPKPEGPHVVQSDVGAKDGLTKCPRCGSTDIALNVATGMLRCAFCRYEWASENALDSLDLNGDIASLSGLVIGSGASDIPASVEEVLTFKCSACGAEVVIDTAHSTQARCHWCRNTLSMNQQIPNGAVPDMVLPFSITKDDAVARIAAFVGKRQFFAHPTFRREFSPENVMGVYLPYMVVDINAHATLQGQGEHQTRSYTVKRGDSTVRRYDADLYDVVRDFDVYVNDLTVESSSERRNQDVAQNTNNVINAIMPFDVEKSVRYDSNYLSGFTAERRDTNIRDLAPLVVTQAQDVARMKVNETLTYYDRGVRWDHENIEVRGQRWVSAYLPVWLYSYYQHKPGGRSLLHYVAVNARTGETMGSVPLNQGRLLAVSAVVQAVGTVLALLIFLVA